LKYTIIFTLNAAIAAKRQQKNEKLNKKILVLKGQASSDKKPLMNDVEIE